MSNLNDRQFAMMRPSDLLLFAEDRTTDPSMRRTVDDLAGSIQRRGYRKSVLNPHNRHGDHIWLGHTDETSFLANGNHRVHAMNQIGYDKPVPVWVSDYRTAQP